MSVEPESPARLRVLFAGYAPVHFVCFRRLYDRLLAHPDVDVFVSGGLRTKLDDDRIEYDTPGLYDRFDLAPDRVLPVEAIRDLDFDVVFAAHTKLILPRRVGSRVQIFHGASFRNRAVRAENMGCDYYFLIGPYMQRRFVSAGLMTTDDPRGVPIGFMKTDPLVNGELHREDLLARYGMDGSRPVLVYAPTGQRNNSLETIGEEVIARLVAEERYDLLIKLHDHPKDTTTDWPKRLSGYEGRHCRLVAEPDVVPLLHAGDLLISDASSVTTEYALLDRPIVFLDVPKLIAKAGRVDGSMLDLETWGRRTGPIVPTGSEIVPTVATSLRNPSTHAAVRQHLASDVFFNPGHATDAAVSWIERELLGAASPLSESSRVSHPLPSG